MKIKAKVQKITYKNGDYRIMSLSPIHPYPPELKLSKKYFTFSCKGDLSYLSEGKEYELELKEIGYSSEYGGSYEVLSVPSMEVYDIENLTNEESFDILMECTSSPRIANNILSAYPTFINMVLEGREEEIDLEKIQGVGEAYFSAYQRNLLTKYKYYHIISMFKPFKLSVDDSKKLCETYGNNDSIKEVLDEKPYSVLIQALGRSFSASDKLILEYNPEFRESFHRCEFFVLNVLRENEALGNTRLSGNLLYHHIKTKCNVPELLPHFVDVCTKSEVIYFDEKSKDVAVLDTYMGEKIIADFIESKMANSKVLDIDCSKYKEIDGFKMSDAQFGALDVFCKNEFSLLIGYSGSGKTVSTRSIVELIEDNNMTYCLLASTGKASMRMRDAVNRPTSTIHRKCMGNGEIVEDVVIVDETSMVDLSTMVMLLTSIRNPHCRIVLVGDCKQLIPVSTGRPFSDMIESGKVPMTILSEVFRYKSNGALFVATNAREGKPFFDSDEDIVKFSNDGKVCNIGGNYKFIQSDNIKEDLIDIYIKEVKKHGAENVLCLSPQNKGELGTYSINNVIQSIINPPKPKEKYMEREIKSENITITFRVGDRVINKKNDYKALPLSSWEMIQNDEDGNLTEKDVPKTAIFNGQDGIIREVDDKKMVIQFDEELVVFDKFKISNLLLANVISTHSSQGSEAEVVINIVSSKHSRMLNKELLYVADTRSKVKHIDIGDMKAYNQGLSVSGNDERNTWLKELLLEEKEETDESVRSN